MIKLRSIVRVSRAVVHVEMLLDGEVLSFDVLFTDPKLGIRLFNLALPVETRIRIETWNEFLEFNNLVSDCSDGMAVEIPPHLKQNDVD